MEKLKCIHWAGWLASHTMSDPGWFKLWSRKVSEEEQKGNELLVFRVPRGISKSLARKIEVLIQESVK